MTTINGVTFNMQTLEPISVVRNVSNDQPGSDENFVTHMGYKGLVMRLTGFEETLATYDNVIKEFMKVGEQTLVHRTGWQFKVHSAQLTPVLLEGFPNNYFPYTLTLITSTPYRESTAETTRSKTITSNGQTWTQDDSSNDIDTDGSVDALPDIQIIGGTTHATSGYTESQTLNDSNYNFNAGSAGLIIFNTTYNTLVGVYSTQSPGQTVNCRKAGMAIITSVDFYVSSVASSGTITCSVYDKVGGTLLGSKALAISTTGIKYFTFATPIVVVQDENTCADYTDSDKIFIEFTTSDASLNLRGNNFDIYTDGRLYINESPYSDDDLYFYVHGNSCDEIRQTFTVPTNGTLQKVTLNMCKYRYSGSNPVTVVVKQGATTLGTGTAVLSGSTFGDVDFVMSEETTDSLDLVTSTTYTIYITPPSNSTNSTCPLIKTKTSNVYGNGAVTLVDSASNTHTPTHDLYFILTLGTSTTYSNSQVKVYNIADASVVCELADEVLDGAIHRINTDGTGSVEYDDDFTTDKYSDTKSGASGITHDTVNDELDIADNGYIYWYVDTKYPITGIPTITSEINITNGVPTIQISSDGSTWYDIIMPLVDSVETEYELDSIDLHLKEEGLTGFYFRFDCVKTAAATCSIINFELDVKMVTIDVEHPKIDVDGISTFRCDQTLSGLACVITLIYRDRAWPM